MPCPSDLQLSVYYDRELSHRMQNKIEKHLSLCPTCQAKVKQLQHLSTFFQPKTELLSPEKEAICYQAIQKAIQSNPSQSTSFSLKKLFSQKRSVAPSLFPLPLLTLAASFLFLLIITGLFLFSLQKAPNSSVFSNNEEILGKTDEPSQQASSVYRLDSASFSEKRASDDTLASNSPRPKAAIHPATRSLISASTSSEASSSQPEETLLSSEEKPSYAQLLKENPLAQSVDQLRHIEAGTEERLSSFSSQKSFSLPIAVRQNEASPNRFSSQTPFSPSAFFSPLFPKRVTPTFVPTEPPLSSSESSTLSTETLSEARELILFEIPSDLSFCTQGIPDFEVLNE